MRLSDASNHQSSYWTPNRRSGSGMRGMGPRGVEGEAVLGGGDHERVAVAAGRGERAGVAREEDLGPRPAITLE
jgi:hypothetical protein